MAIVTKEESMLLIQHAISGIINEGENQQVLAKYLEVDPPRLTEAKKGRWTMRDYHRTLIIDRFGYPRRGKGEYIKASVYETVSAFTDDYVPSSKVRYKRRLYELFTRTDYQLLIGSYFILPDFIGIDNPDALKMKLHRLEKLLLLDGFTQWLDEQRSNDSNNKSIDTLADSILFEVGLTISSFVENRVYIVLYKLGLFKVDVMPSFTFASTADVPSLANSELVLTGDVVLNYSDIVNETGTLNSVSCVHGEYGRSFFPTCAGNFIVDSIVQGSEINSMPDHWNKVEMRLFLSENMEYHLVINLIKECYVYDINDARNVVVTCIDRIGFLQEIEKMRKWLGLSYDMHDQLKSKLAKVGGFIPGARVL